MDATTAVRASQRLGLVILWGGVVLTFVLGRCSGQRYVEAGILVDSARALRVMQEAKLDSALTWARKGQLLLEQADEQWAALSVSEDSLDREIAAWRQRVARATQGRGGSSEAPVLRGDRPDSRSPLHARGGGSPDTASVTATPTTVLEVALAEADGLLVACRNVVDDCQHAAMVRDSALAATQAALAVSMRRAEVLERAVGVERRLRPGWWQRTRTAVTWAGAGFIVGAVLTR